jgi:hypothetical protein
MIYKLAATYHDLAELRAADHVVGRALPVTPGSKVRVGWVRRVVKVSAVVLVEATIVLGFVLVSLGVGSEGSAVTTSDRSQQLAEPAPAPPPDQAPTGR